MQARSTADSIFALPLVFLGCLGATRSPCLEVYRLPGGELFLAVMLGVI